VGYAVVGNHDKALESLEHALSNLDDELTFCIRYPAFDPIRSGPRYTELMRRLGLPE